MIGLITRAHEGRAGGPGMTAPTGIPEVDELISVHDAERHQLDAAFAVSAAEGTVATAWQNELLAPACPVVQGGSLALRCPRCPVSPARPRRARPFEADLDICDDDRNPTTAGYRRR